MTFAFLGIALNALALVAPPSAMAVLERPSQVEKLHPDAPREDASVAIEEIEETEDTESEHRPFEVRTARPPRAFLLGEATPARVVCEHDARLDAAADHDPRGPPIA